MQGVPGKLLSHACFGRDAQARRERRHIVGAESTVASPLGPRAPLPGHPGKGSPASQDGRAPGGLLRGLGATSS